MKNTNTPGVQPTEKDHIEHHKKHLINVLDKLGNHLKVVSSLVQAIPFQSSEAFNQSLETHVALLEASARILKALKIPKL